MTRQPAIYIMASGRNGTLYVGVTSDLVRRAGQHREAGAQGAPTHGFAARYGCSRLVYFELLEGMTEAIAREKQIKAGSRARKITLIERNNPTWKDLYDEIV
jgi:predicted GIY-YIG superfamily endonuclease